MEWDDFCFEFSKFLLYFSHSQNHTESGFLSLHCMVVTKVFKYAIDNKKSWMGFNGRGLICQVGDSKDKNETLSKDQGLKWNTKFVEYWYEHSKKLKTKSILKPLD